MKLVLDNSAREVLGDSQGSELSQVYTVVQCMYHIITAEECLLSNQLSHLHTVRS